MVIGDIESDWIGVESIYTCDVTVLGVCESSHRRGKILISRVF